MKRKSDRLHPVFAGLLAVARGIGIVPTPAPEYWADCPHCGQSANQRYRLCGHCHQVMTPQSKWDLGVDAPKQDRRKQPGSKP